MADIQHTMGPLISLNESIFLHFHSYCQFHPLFVLYFVGIPMSHFNSPAMSQSQLLASLQTGLSRISPTNSLFPRVPTSPLLEESAIRPPLSHGAVINRATTNIQSNLISPPLGHRSLTVSRHSILDRLSSLEQTIVSAHQQTSYTEARANTAVTTNSQSFGQTIGSSPNENAHVMPGARFNFPGSSRPESAAALIRGAASPAVVDDHGALNLSARSSSVDSSSKDSPLAADRAARGSTD